MRHKQTDTVLAVKRIPMTVNIREQHRLVMDLDISMRSSDCPYTVHFYGAMYREGDVWICMEVMSTSLDKFYPKVFLHDLRMEESVLGKVSWGGLGAGLILSGNRHYTITVLLPLLYRLP